jgi:hypothetical protein
VYVEAILLNLLVNLVLVDINVFKLSAKLILLLYNYTYSYKRSTKSLLEVR